MERISEGFQPGRQEPVLTGKTFVVMAPAADFCDVCGVHFRVQAFDRLDFVFAVAIGAYGHVGDAFDVVFSVDAFQVIFLDTCVTVSTGGHDVLAGYPGIGVFGRKDVMPPVAGHACCRHAQAGFSEGPVVDAVVVVFDEVLPALSLNLTHMTPLAGVGEVDGKDRGRGVVLGEDVMSSVAVFTGDTGGPSVGMNAAFELALGILMTDSAVDWGQIFGVGKILDSFEITMAVDTGQASLTMDRSLVILLINVERGPRFGFQVLV